MIHCVKLPLVLEDEHLVLERVGALDLGDILHQNFKGGRGACPLVFGDVKDLAAGCWRTWGCTARKWSRRRNDFNNDRIRIHGLDVWVFRGWSGIEPCRVAALAGRPERVEHVVVEGDVDEVGNLVLVLR